MGRVKLKIEPLPGVLLTQHLAAMHLH